MRPDHLGIDAFHPRERIRHGHETIMPLLCVADEKFGWGFCRTDKSCVGGIAAHPCKERKDGAPSVGVVHAKIV
jgi:hypothetical protein